MSDLKDAIRYAIFEKITSPDSEIVDTVLYIRRALKERNQIVPDFESKEKFSIGLIVPISLPQTLNQVIVLMSFRKLKDISISLVVVQRILIRVGHGLMITRRLYATKAS